MPRKGFGSVSSADSDTIHIQHFLSLSTQKAVPKFPNTFRGTHMYCIKLSSISKSSTFSDNVQNYLWDEQKWTSCGNLMFLLGKVVFHISL